MLGQFIATTRSRSLPPIISSVDESAVFGDGVDSKPTAFLHGPKIREIVDEKLTALV
jgi:hypothetical protein